MKLNLAILFVFVLSVSAFAQLSPEPIAALPKGMVRGKIIRLAKPEYPAAARAVRASGVVNVSITIDEEGNVIAAAAQTGHPLLRSAAEQAARETKFTPTTIDGKPTKVRTVLGFNFSTFQDKTTWEAVGEDLMILLNNRSPVGSAPFPKSAIWKGLDDEYAEFASLQNRLEAGDARERGIRLMDKLRSKLKARGTDELWYLNMGIANAGLNQNTSITDREDFFYNYLRDIAKLIETAPADLAPKRLASLNEAAKYAGDKNLSKEKRAEIVKMLIESRNLSVNGIN